MALSILGTRCFSSGSTLPQTAVHGAARPASEREPGGRFLAGSWERVSRLGEVSTTRPWVHGSYFWTRSYELEPIQVHP